MRVESDGELIAEYGDLATAAAGHAFFGEHQSRIQVVSLRFDRGKVMRPRMGVKHRVELPEATAQKLMFVFRGSLRVNLYDQKRQVCDQRTLGPGQFVACYSGGHGFEVLSDDTILLEVKSGPFLGDETDRVFIED